MLDNPFLQELKDEYTNLRKKGIGRQEAVAALMSKYREELTKGDYDDGKLFWVGLADAQFSVKELSSEVAEKGTDALKSLAQMGIVSARSVDRRLKNYACAPMPERAKIKDRPKYCCSWAKGDVFAYRLSGPEAEAVGLDGQYVIIRSVDTIYFGDGRLLPVVTLSLWNTASEPVNADAVKTAQLLILTYGRFGLPENLFEYRAIIMFQSKAQEKKLALKYLGNICDIEMPHNEVVIKGPGKTAMLCPATMDRDVAAFWKMHNYAVNNLCT